MFLDHFRGPLWFWLLFGQFLWLSKVIGKTRNSNMVDPRWTPFEIPPCVMSSAYVVVSEPRFQDLFISPCTRCWFSNFTVNRV